jgi:hypothetical protein
MPHALPLLATLAAASLPAGETALLPRGGELTLTAAQSAVCELSARPDERPLVVVVRGRESLGDVHAALGETRTLTLRCDQAVSLAAPAARLASDGSVVFRSDDVFVPQRGTPTRRYPFAAPAQSTYRVATLALDVTPGAFDRDTGGLHSLFWFQRGSRWRGSLIGYGNVRGPGKNIALLSSNLDLPAKQMVRATRGFRPERGVTYRVEMRYDVPRRTSTLNILRDGAPVLASPITTPTTGRLATGAGDFFVEVGFAHGGNHGPERPTYGWVYRNLEVQLLP